MRCWQRLFLVIWCLSFCLFDVFFCLPLWILSIPAALVTLAAAALSCSVGIQGASIFTMESSIFHWLQQTQVTSYLTFWMSTRYHQAATCPSQWWCYLSLQFLLLIATIHRFFPPFHFYFAFDILSICIHPKQNQHITTFPCTTAMRVCAFGCHLWGAQSAWCRVHVSDLHNGLSIEIH